MERKLRAKAEQVRQFVVCGLESTDQRVKEGKSITPMFLYAVMLWPAIQQRAAELADDDEYSEVQALSEASHEIVADQQATTSLPRRFAVPMREVLQLQYRFEKRRGVRAARFVEHKRFRAAYDFLLLRAACGEVEQELADWWTEVQSHGAAERNQAFGVGRRKSRGRRGGRKRQRRRTTGDAVS